MCAAVPKWDYCQIIQPLDHLCKPSLRSLGDPRAEETTMYIHVYIHINIHMYLYVLILVKKNIYTAYSMR